MFIICGSELNNCTWFYCHSKLPQKRIEQLIVDPFIKCIMNNATLDA